MPWNKQIEKTNKFFNFFNVESKHKYNFHFKEKKKKNFLKHFSILNELIKTEFKWSNYLIYQNININIK